MLCAEAGDLSPLSPLSVRDVIWVSTAQSVLRRQGYRIEEAKAKAQTKLAEALLVGIDDLRFILVDSNFFTRLAAMKPAVRSVKPIDPETLPSGKAAKEEKARRFAMMTPEEQEAERIKDALAGKKYVPH